MGRRFSIILSPHIGYCFGVKRAMSLIEKGLEEREGNIYVIGEIIHNPQAVERLKKLGAKSVNNVKEVDEGGTLVIRAHGVKPEIIEEARQKGLDLLDATCPFVHRSHSYVKELSEKSFHVIIIGDRDHPEVQGIAGYAEGNVTIVKNLEEVAQMDTIDRAGMVVQTTYAPEKASELIEAIKKKVKELVVYDTICQATVARREATMDLAKQVDLMIIVGGKHSSNTRRLFQMCRDAGINSRFIERIEEIEDDWFEGVSHVGLSTGTSTPDWVIEEVKQRLRDISEK